MDNEIDRKIDVTAILFLLVQNRQQRLGWTLIGSGANGLGILECVYMKFTLAGVALIKPSETLNKDKFVFFFEFPWLLGHPVYQIILHFVL